MNSEMAEIAGMSVGDGCISITKRYSEFAISGDLTEEKDYYDTWVMPLLNRKLFLPILGRELKAKAYPKTGVYGVITFNKQVVQRLLQMGLKKSPKISHGIPEQIKCGSPEIKRRFLRGLFDTDGSISFERNYSAQSKRHNKPRIFLGSVSRPLIVDCAKICRGVGFHIRFRKPWKGKRDKNIVYGIAIDRKPDIERWIEEIGFKSPKHTTKILLWKQIGECPPFTTIKQRKKMLGLISSSAKLKDLKFRAHLVR